MACICLCGLLQMGCSDEPGREVFEAAKSGDAVLLCQILQKLNSSERASALETKLRFSSSPLLQCKDVYVTPLIVSVQNGNLDCVKILLKYEADIESRGGGDIKTNLDSIPYTCEGYTPLFVAAAYGNLEIVSFLLENGADDNTRTTDFFHCTPLMIASNRGLVNVVTFLIEHGANVDLKDKTSKTALHYAVDHDQDLCDVVSCLIKNGANVNSQTYYKYTPLMIASKKSHVNVVNLLAEHGANTAVKDKAGRTALHHALLNEGGSCDILNCLINNGADVNARTNDNYTPLMCATESGRMNIVTFLIDHGADIHLQDKDGQTALHYFGRRNTYSCDLLRYLIKNGANVNALTNDHCTPLMKASECGAVDIVIILTEHGANVHLKDKKGDTALHYAACSNNFEVVHKLLSLGASELCNSQGLTPLLSASNKCAISVVEKLITRPECTKEQRIDALELLGASLFTEHSYLSSLGKGFEYMKRGMEERFADPSHPLLKQPMEPVEAYQNRKESQTPKELAWIEHDIDALLMESLMIKDRILKTDNVELLGPIRYVANCHENCKDRRRLSICIGLYNYAIKIAKSCNQSAISDLRSLTFLHAYKIWRNVPPKQKDLLELLEQIVFEYEKLQKLGKGLEAELDEFSHVWDLFTCTSLLVSFIPKFKYCEQGKAMLQNILQINPRNYNGDTLLHKVVVKEVIKEPFPCINTLKLLLKEGFNVNAVNKIHGDTPLHRAVTFKPSNDELHLLTDMLEVLLDGGAHHDFVNNDGKTAMDMAATDEARTILSEKRKLELKCISAGAVKKYGVSYLGMVPKKLEKYISMH